ncbi:MAG TPA: hypothetical protein PLQ78_08245 [Flavipsychrobacter sp.]|nr:hypothetical protein [Flavipsychrobacter sp.]
MQSLSAMAQSGFGNPTTLTNQQPKDTSKTNTSTWQDEPTKIYYTQLTSKLKFYPDTLLHQFHRRNFSQPWLVNTGNQGSPTTSLLFKPEERVGPTLGYHVFDVYRFQLDSLKYYNTTRPYSVFTYQLGSKVEQLVSLLHTQNIKPNWNVAMMYRKVNSPGYYKIQRTNTDNAFLTTNYTSTDKHYSLHAAVVYNKEQNDENGGIVSDSLLELDEYSNRSVIPVLFQSSTYGTRRSPVTNMQRDVAALLQHSYTFGATDTSYNEDSTQFTTQLKPRFGLTHRLSFSSEKYQFKDLRPSREKYIGFFNYSFPNASDSVFTEQKWWVLDNALLLNGFLGKPTNPLSVNVGWGIRSDKFSTEYGIGEQNTQYISNYLTGTIKKEAFEPQQWGYEGAIKLFFSGQAAGSFLVDAALAKRISKTVGSVQLGFSQALHQAPYNYTRYQNQFVSFTKSYNKESSTKLFATWHQEQWKLSAGVTNYLISNFIYLDASLQFSQYAPSFNLTQVWLQKRFSWRQFYLDNEIVYQQKTNLAPVNVPLFMGRHKIAIETRAFKKALLLAAGLDVWYHTPYTASGYAPFLNRFYYQDAITASNYPVVAVFFNFKVKSFRAYVMVDQLQQLFTTNTVLISGYPAQNTMFRFGFNWVLIN